MNTQYIGKRFPTFKMPKGEIYARVRTGNLFGDDNVFWRWKIRPPDFNNLPAQILRGVKVADIARF